MRRSILLTALSTVGVSMFCTGCGMMQKTQRQESAKYVVNCDSYMACVMTSALAPTMAFMIASAVQASAENEASKQEAGEVSQEDSYEDFYEYEIKEDDTGTPYSIIKGFKGDLGEDVAKKVKKLTQNYYYFTLPEVLEGAIVKEIAPNAFQNVDLGSYWKALSLSPALISIGEGSFQNCGITKMELKGTELSENIMTQDHDVDSIENSIGRKVSVGDRAFADNPELWGIWLSDTEPVFGREVFTGCALKQYLCYRSYQTGPEDVSKQLELYAAENGMEAVEIPAYCSDAPFVHIPKEPLTLTAEVKNFFYGESADDELFCAFTYDDNAPDFGFPEWHVPCGEFCAMSGGRYEIMASSELASQNNKYAARNLVYGRETAWAEGVPGYGIGESIRVTSSCSYSGKWDGEVFFYEGDLEPDVFDGYMRYTQICIVNGYAKSQKTWEENGRVKRMLMYVEGQPYAYLELEDTIRPQYFTLPINDIKAFEGVDVHFEFVIDEVYPGTKYEDTCLTGLVVEFMGRHGH
ncbi:NADase-type glycan-binding domain-containing protein [Parablautia muri]|uniref:NAD glycohydrolase translocation F5/8 type C domain-containing protein n=1 Tax=Parablautia muri TaxID=2320879 RepID=A0A9X5BCY1_9FIRM|nr:hypothetical protein [Parablautia muri]NBJ91461.1 hypothetical protein [Parablautia muri]